jgi:hypothetical protein
MNRLILIGNGFDLAHSLKTSYKNFLSNYWENIINSIINNKQNARYGEFNNEQVTISERMPVNHKIGNILEHIRQNISHIGFKNNFLKQLTTKQFLENWVDIEFEYFENLKIIKTKPELLIKLNSEMKEIKYLLINYLKQIDIEEANNNFKLKRNIGNLIYEDFSKQDLTDEVLKYEFSLHPNEILFLNFNYTNTESIYDEPSKFLKRETNNEKFKISTIHIHGTLKNALDNPIIFGYGDEIDEEYKELEKLNNTMCLDFIKSIAYLDSPNYKKLIRFIDNDYYQILIMGHSCGVSDRTLLNTIFEHKNCCSIKPYYYQIDENNDNYSDLIKNITRNFHNKAIMRERVVNKIYTKALK